MRVNKKMASTGTLKAQSAPTLGPQSVGRVLSILEHVASRQDGATLTELATHAQAPKTSLAGLIKGLVEEGALWRETSGRYVCGERLYALAAQVSPGRDLAKLVRPSLIRLMQATGETVVLGVPADDDDVVVYIDKVETDSPVRYTVNVGERREMYCTSMGKALLAHAPAAQVKRVLSPRHLKRFTARTIISPEALRKALAAIREEGIARTQGERIEGADGLAAPLFGPNRQAIAAILIAGPSSRMAAHKTRIERDLRETARALNLVLSGVSTVAPT